MNIMVIPLMPSRSTSGREVFGGVTRIEPIDGPDDARNRVRIWVGDDDHSDVDLNLDAVELLPENH